VETPVRLSPKLIAENLQIQPSGLVKLFDTDQSTTKSQRNWTDLLPSVLPDPSQKGFKEWLEKQHWAVGDLSPEWRCEFTVRAVEDKSSWFLLERLTGKLYPRYRDAHLALYTALNRSSMRSLSEYSVDFLKHPKTILKGLTRHLFEHFEGKKQPECPLFWYASEKLSFQSVDGLSLNEGQLITTLRSIPLAHFGIMRRLWTACEKEMSPQDRRIHMEQSYLMLDRICYWLQQIHRWAHDVLLKSPDAGQMQPASSSVQSPASL
jgi:hypothetical protein